jgi:hypothetical protein
MSKTEVMELERVCVPMQLKHICPSYRICSHASVHTVHTAHVPDGLPDARRDHVGGVGKEDLALGVLAHLRVLQGSCGESHIELVLVEVQWEYGGNTVTLTFPN